MHSHCLSVPVQLAVSAPAALALFLSLSVVVCVFTSLPPAYAGYVKALTLDMNRECRGSHVETELSLIIFMGIIPAKHPYSKVTNYFLKYV